MLSNLDGFNILTELKREAALKGDLALFAHYTKLLKNYWSDFIIANTIKPKYETVILEWRSK